MITPTSKTMLAYPGAKWSIADWIIGYLPPTPIYLESHCGSAAVFLRLPWKPENAVLNDRSGDVTNLFRVVREQGDTLAALIEMTPYSRLEYKISYEPCDDDLERARRFLVRSWQAMNNQLHHSSGWRRQGTALSYVTPTAKWRDLPARILATIDRLRDAEIETQDAAKLIAQHASANVLIYADPPYPFSTRNGKMYQYEMTDADHLALLEILDVHPGPAALSGYRCDIYDTRLAHWKRVERSAQTQGGKRELECLWLNPICVERLGYGPMFEVLS